MMIEHQVKLCQPVLTLSPNKLRYIIEDINEVIDGQGGLVVALDENGNMAALAAGYVAQQCLTPGVISPAIEMSSADTCYFQIPSFIYQQYDLTAEFTVFGIYICNSDDERIGCYLQVIDKQKSQDPLLVRCLKLVEKSIGVELEKALTANENQALTRRVSLLNEIGSISQTGGWEVDLTTGEVTWTDETYNIYGISKSDKITAEYALSFFQHEGRLQVEKYYNNLIANGDTYEHETILERKDGTKLWVKVTGKARRVNGVITQIYGVIEDISEHYKLLEAEQNYAAYLSAILDNLNDAVVTINEFGDIVTTNRAIETIFGYTQHDLEGKNIKILMPESYAKNHDQYMLNYLETGHAKIIGFGRELTAQHASGRIFPMELSLSEVMQNGQRLFIGIVRDITERKKASDELYRMAYFDQLTKLPNMQSFNRDLNAVIKGSQNGKLEIYSCLIDIDNFAQYNLSFGKDIGDMIIKNFSDRITSLLPESFKAYRGIGDNFMILKESPVLDTDLDCLAIITKFESELYQKLHEPMLIFSLNHMITVALSSARILGRSASYETLTSILAFGNKRAKKQGVGGRVALDKSAFEDYTRHNLISHSFVRAFEDNEFYLMLQPKFDAHRKIIGSEALIRWEHGLLGSISPAEFISIAEESDAVIDIGYWVLDEVCRILAKCQKENIYTRVAVNISGKHIVRMDFADRLQVVLEKWKISPQQIVFEITETTLVTSIDLVRERIETLSKLGYSFSIDDFGTGYSSLSYLKELPIAELKIDRYFVDEINFNGEEVPIVNSIIDLAQALGVHTVAEGIENPFQLDYLKKHGCHYYQGYYLSRPLPEKAWLSLITTNLS
jgi:PAS domain S-box-containing protein/diguanylate cyclase (GGDEF)-like protein